MSTTSHSDSESTISSLSLPSPSSSVSGDCDCCQSIDEKAQQSLPVEEKKEITKIEADQFHTVIIIGAGPHGLAVAARLRESHPGALYTDLEHARIKWLRTSSSTQNEHRAPPKDHERTKKTPKHIALSSSWSTRKLVATCATPPSSACDIKVLDGTSDTWLGRWDGFFKGLGISHLRSPMFFHPCPAEVDAMVAYASRTGREKELVPIQGVVGKELSKHKRKKNHSKRIGQEVPINERSREDYHRPSTPLFRSFIQEEVIDRYNLSSLVTRTTVTSLSYGSLHIEGQDLCEGFVVDSLNPDGTTSRRGAKAFVIAIGPHERPAIPQVILREERGYTVKDPEETRKTIEGDGWCHSTCFSKPGFRFPNKELRARMRMGKEVRMAVIGGGLTSAQICEVALSRGVTHVTLICRSHIKIKHFDFPLTWVSKFANLSKMAFWHEEDPEKRLSMIKEARDGGSVNPTYWNVLKKAEREGKLDIHTRCEVRDARWDRQGKEWELMVGPVSKGTQGEEDVTTLKADFVVCSTGSMMSFDTIPFLQPLLKLHPIEVIGGLPNVTKDLQWNTVGGSNVEEGVGGIPCFVVGGYGMLELGPDGTNLSGTRHGADRVVSRLTSSSLSHLGIASSATRGELDGLGPGNNGKNRTRARWQQEKESRSGGADNFFKELGECEC
ncbi:hypothetical protein T439DRAFT_291719 [Meredithblackwellia eburnea MCA 4105]